MEAIGPASDCPEVSLSVGGFFADFDRCVLAADCPGGSSSSESDAPATGLGLLLPGEFKGSLPVLTLRGEDWSSFCLDEASAFWIALPELEPLLDSDAWAGALDITLPPTWGSVSR